MERCFPGLCASALTQVMMTMGAIWLLACHRTQWMLQVPSQNAHDSMLPPLASDGVKFSIDKRCNSGGKEARKIVATASENNVGARLAHSYLRTRTLLVFIWKHSHLSTNLPTTCIGNFFDQHLIRNSSALQRCMVECYMSTQIRARILP